MMMMQLTSVLVRVAAVSMLLGYVAAGQTSAPPLDSIVEKVGQAQAQAHSGPGYQVTREYQLAPASSTTSDSEVVVEVQFRPPSSKDYAIEKSSGSGRGLKIVRKILDHEVEQAKNNQPRNAVTGENYSFTYLGEAAIEGQPCFRLGLIPKRKDSELIAGEALVDERTFLIRQIEGQLAKTPSWWLKDVHVKISFAGIDGNWVQTGVEAVADVRLLGAEKLTSRTLDYRSAEVMASNGPATHHPVRVLQAPKGQDGTHAAR